MDITLDITKQFNSLVNHDYFFDGPPMNPALFIKKPNDIHGDYVLELMNFGLNISEDILNEFSKNAPHFDNIIKCKYAYKRLIIFGKARFCFNGIKGADMKFSVLNESKRGKTLYYTCPYEVKKGDYKFSCGGHSTFSQHYILIYLVADCDAKATVTFSSDDYMLIDSNYLELEDLASKRQTTFFVKETEESKSFLNNCTSVPGKMFDIAFLSKYFKNVFTDGFNTTIAIDSEM